ncbi:MAG: class I SAM-dependent methyltransferase [Pseudorhizobium sp.]
MTGTQGYGENAQALAQQYESVSFAAVHRDVLHLYPAPPARVVDIGAGSGRDAAALAASGHKVVAVEPTEALRPEGMRIHAGKPIVWLDDQLPALARLHSLGESFDLILLTAVWMHLDLEERYSAMKSLAGLVLKGGRISMSLRHGPVPLGRKMFDVSATETVELASSVGLNVIHAVEREDMLGRPEVHWSFLVLEKR